MHKLPHIKILILNWNGIGVIENCLNSLSEISYENHSITIIDNGSLDKSIEYINISHPAIDIIKIEKNIGYSAGYNYALKKLLNDGSDFYLLLNNDTILQDDLLKTMYANIKLFGDNNIYSPKIMYADNPKKVWYAGAKLNSFLGSSSHIGIREEENLLKYKTRITGYVSGCCMLIKKDLINKLGGFNDTFRMYYEDVDLCHRAKKYDSKCFVIEECSILHKVSYSLNNNKIKKICLKLSSMIKFIYLNNNIIFFIMALVCHSILTPVYMLKVVYEEV